MNGNASGHAAHLDLASAITADIAAIMLRGCKI
jgi:hypothetical protein